MPLPLLVAFFLDQTQQTVPPTQTTPPTQNQAPAPLAPPFSFASAPAVVDPSRIELSPKLDGKILDEEWDAFTTTPDAKTYLQWEPGIIYAAATGPAGSDLVLSLDLAGKGWLVGRKHIEARVSIVDGKPKISVRRLDATNVSGPAWQDLPGFTLASEAFASSDASGVTYELKLVDPGVDDLPTKIGKISARVDLEPSTDPAQPPFVPRLLAPVSLVDTRSAALPASLKWNIEHNDRPVTPTDSTFMRFTFDSKPPTVIRKIHMQSEGLAKDDTNDVTMPFPPFDKKGRAFVDYNTKISPTAELGYRVLRGTLTLDDGSPAVLEACYRIAPLIDIDIVHDPLRVSNNDRSIKVGFYLSSNYSRALSGNVSIRVPDGFRALNGGEEQKFAVERQGKIRKALDLLVPAKSAGTFPLVFQVTVGGKKIEKTQYLIVE